MAQQTINVGTTAGDGTGDTPRAGGQKINANFTEVYAHAASAANPHSVTKSQVGLGNVDNTSDAAKPISDATQSALDAKQESLVSGTNIKTVNGSSLLGSGNVVISGGGTPGDSAYEIAVNNGFVGTEPAWLASLVGDDGADGTDGADGANGGDGASAYEVAVANGFVGNEAAWLASLVGEAGADGADGIDGDDGATGATGSTGAAGPNTVTTSTTTDITGMLKGNGANVLGATAGTDYLAPSALTNNIAGDGTVLSVVKLTQAAYDGLTPVATTLYVIVG